MDCLETAQRHFGDPIMSSSQVKELADVAD